MKELTYEFHESPTSLRNVLILNVDKDCGRVVINTPETQYSINI